MSSCSSFWQSKSTTLNGNSLEVKSIDWQTLRSTVLQPSRANKMKTSFRCFASCVHNEVSLFLSLPRVHLCRHISFLLARRSAPSHVTFPWREETVVSGCWGCRKTTITTTCQRHLADERVMSKHWHDTQQLPRRFMINVLGIREYFLWSPYVIGQTIIFLSCDFYLLLFFLA